MATLGGARLTTCNDTCGCPTPCPGGLSCRCATRSDSTTAADHKKCSCGAHCGCNPCSCASKVVTTGVGKAYCKCGDACNCVSCAA
ncbi:PREDICTED: EC protein homolog 1-like [Fragaria vesca subsp. vesca]